MNTSDIESFKNQCYLLAERLPRVNGKIYKGARLLNSVSKAFDYKDFNDAKYNAGGSILDFTKITNLHKYTPFSQSECENGLSEYLSEKPISSLDYGNISEVLIDVDGMDPSTDCLEFILSAVDFYKAQESYEIELQPAPGGMEVSPKLYDELANVKIIVLDKSFLDCKINVFNRIEVSESGIVKAELNILAAPLLLSL